jgi:hypothetical protein
MKRVLLSICIGCVITWLLFLYGAHPRSGPTPIIALLMVPFQLLASFVIKDQIVGEILYYGMQVIVMSLLSYVVLYIVSQFRKREGD